MKNIISFVKDKIYYVMGGTILLIIIIVIIGACSNGSSSSSYSNVEKKLVSAAQKYYSAYPKELPVEENGKVKITLGTLIDGEYIKEVKDPSDSTNICSGYVLVTKIGEEYSYIPYLTCKENYEPTLLTDEIKNSQLDEYGNGVYESNGRYVYKGGDVNNYVSFSELTWRIIKIDTDGTIEIVDISKDNNRYNFDGAYNSEIDNSYGNTNDYLHTNIRDVLNSYYDVFSTDEKARIVSKNICIGKYDTENMDTVPIDNDYECSIVKENEKVSLLNVSDYARASLDSQCTTITAANCVNYNYITNDIDSWTLNTASNNSYTAFYIDGRVSFSRANFTKKINKVIYLSPETLLISGSGSLEDPYIIK